jgi:gamma-glutamylcysteine synthetase
MRESYASLHSHALSCLKAVQQQLKHLREKATSSYQEEVRLTRDAERTIAAELSRSVKSSRIAASHLETCAKAIAEASRQQKITRDTLTLNFHKEKLHAIALKIAELLKSV